MSYRYAVYLRGVSCACCAWETIRVFSSRRDAKRFVAGEKRLVIVREDAEGLS